MDIVLISLIASGAVILVLIASNVFLAIYFRKTTKNLDELLEKGKIKDFKDVFLSQKERSDDLENQLKTAFFKIDNLEKISERTIQKIGIVRFDPFNELGGKQSFAIAILDDRNNGFILSSLIIKEGNKVYAKPVKGGKSDYVLSNEELEAIERAINNK